MKTNLRLLVTAAALLFSSSGAGAFNQPGLNLGLTSVLDGGPVPPGVYLVEYAQFSRSGPPVDKDGKVIPGGGEVSSLASVHQIIAFSPYTFAKGLIGFDIVQPVVAVTAKGTLGVPLTANTAGLGDFVLGPTLQWNNGSLLGRPYFSRFEIDFVLPTGKYDRNFSANPGSHLFTIEPYYSLTWILSQQWETSWRFFYAIHGENHDTHIKPGHVFHFNYAASRAVGSRWRIGTSGYLLQQVTNDWASGTTIPDSKEFTYALGPALAYTGSLVVELSHPIEIVARNRFKTSRTTLQMVYKF